MRRPTMRNALVAITMLLILMGGAGPKRQPEPAVSGLKVHAVRVSAIDLEQAVSFYTGHLGFDRQGEFGQHGFEMLVNGGVALVVTKAAAPVEIPDDASHVVMRFHATNLDQRAADLRAAGVACHERREPNLGRVLVVVDPSGNRIWLVEAESEVRHAANRPRLVGVDMVVTDVRHALDFYRDALGFDAKPSDDIAGLISFDQGVIPVTIRGGAQQTAPYLYGMKAHIGLALQTPDLETAMRSLGERGVAVLHEKPLETAGVRYVALSDPFGNMHELIHHADHVDDRPDAIPPATAATTNRAGKPSVSDLTWLAGRWTLRQGEDDLEETWSPPLADSVSGMFRWVRGGKTWMYELMTIEQDDSGLVLRLRHFGRALEPWEADGPLTYPLKSLDGHEVVFENPAEDDPRRFLYRRNGNHLTVRLEPADPGARIDQFVFTLAN